MTRHHLRQSRGGVAQGHRHQRLRRLPVARRRRHHRRHQVRRRRLGHPRRPAAAGGAVPAASTVSTRASARTGGRTCRPRPTAPILRRHVVLVFVDKLDMATARAVQYARTLTPDDLRAVHFAVDPDARRRAAHRLGGVPACPGSPSTSSTAPTGVSTAPRWHWWPTTWPTATPRSRPAAGPQVPGPVAPRPARPAPPTPSSGPCRSWPTPTSRPFRSTSVAASTGDPPSAAGHARGPAGPACAPTPDGPRPAADGDGDRRPGHGDRRPGRHDPDRASVRWRQRVTVEGRVTTLRIAPTPGGALLEVVIDRRHRRGSRSSSTAGGSIGGIGARQRTYGPRARSPTHRGRLALFNPVYTLLVPRR